MYFRKQVIEIQEHSLIYQFPQELASRQPSDTDLCKAHLGWLVTQLKSNNAVQHYKTHPEVLAIEPAPALGCGFACSPAYAGSKQYLLLIR